MKQVRPLIAIVDDDESVRESLPDLLAELGFDARTFSSAEAFLEANLVGEADCFVFDVSMPGMSGPELHQELARRGSRIPVIFITAHADSDVRPSLLEQGAVDCLFKPFSEAALVGALRGALASH